MEAIPFALPLISIFLALPLMTGWVAKASGRSFWVWAGLTCLLPGITLVALLIMPDKKKAAYPPAG